MTTLHKNLFLMNIIIGLALTCTLAPYPVKAQTAYPADRIMVIKWNSAGDKIAVGYGDGAIRIFNPATNQLLQTLQGHTNSIGDLARSPDGTRLVSGGFGQDSTTRVWNVNTSQQIYVFSGFGLDISSVGWSPDGNQIMANPAEGEGQIWNANTGQLSQTFNTGTSYAIVWSPDDTKIAFALAVGHINILGSSDFQQVDFSNPGIDSQTVSLAWEPTGSSVALGTMNGDVYIWNTNTDQFTFEGQANSYQGNDRFRSWVVDLQFTSTGDSLTAISGDGTLRSWNINTGELIGTSQINQPVYGADFSPDGTKLAFGGTGISAKDISILDLPAYNFVNKFGDFTVSFQNSHVKQFILQGISLLYWRLINLKGS